MSGELERLLIRIEADTAILRRELANSEKAVAGFATGMDRQLKKTQGTFDNFAGQISRSLLRFGALFGTAQLGFKAFDALVKASDINDLARNTALTTEQFQAFSFAVERAGGTQEAFSKGMVRLAKNMAELRANQGGFNEFLNASLPGLRDQLAQTKSQEEALNAVADTMRRLGDEESRSTLAIKAFGKGGEDLVEVLAKGSAQLQRFKNEAQNMGLIISQEQLDNFEQLGDDIRKAGVALETYFVKSAGGAWTYWKNLNVEISKTIASSPELLNALGSIQDALNLSPSKPSSSLFGSGLAAGAKAAAIQAQKVADENPLTFKVKVDNAGRDALASLHTQMLSSTPGREREAIYADMDQELQRFQDMLAEKKITDEQFQQARTDLSAIAMNKISANITEENAKFREQFRELESVIGRTFDDGLTQILKNGKVEWKELARDMLADLAKLTVQLAIIKPLMNGLFGGGASAMGGGSSGLGGGLLSMLPMLLGGARAEGGPVSPGKTYLVGEKGPELFSPKSGGHIIPNGASFPEVVAPRIGGTTRGGGGGGNVFNFNTTVDARGADAGVEKRLTAAMEARDRAQRQAYESNARQTNRFPSRGTTNVGPPPVPFVKRG